MKDSEKDSNEGSGTVDVSFGELGAVVQMGGITACPDFDFSGTTCDFNPWSAPTRMGVIEYADKIEMIYKETSMITQTYPFGGQDERVFKIVFSCVDGKWNKSERIYGDIQGAREEHYTFDD